MALKPAQRAWYRNYIAVAIVVVLVIMKIVAGINDGTGLDDWLF